MGLFAKLKLGARKVKVKAAPSEACSAGWHKLPLELRQELIKMACLDAQGDSTAQEACLRLARARLNLVCREFEDVVSPLQWQHLVLHTNSDPVFFARHLLTKHSQHFCQVTLDWRGYYGRLKFKDDPAWDLLADFPAMKLLRPTAPRASSDTLLYLLFRYTLSISPTIRDISMHVYDWPGCVQPEAWAQVPGVAGRVRRMETSCASSDANAYLSLLLQLRESLEVLHIAMSTFGFLRRSGTAPKPGFAPFGLEPCLPQLRLLAAPLDAIGEFVSQPPVSPVLQEIRWAGRFPHRHNLSALVDNYAGSLKTMVVDERLEWENEAGWSWEHVRRSWGTVSAAKAACDSHGIAFRWLVPAQHKLEGEGECPEDLVGLLELV